MKKTSPILTAALLVAGALLTTGCTNDDIAADNNAAKTVTFTATLAPKGDNGGQTRVITTGKDANNKDVLNVAWAEGEEIGVYYEKTNGNHAMVEATVTAVDGETGVATISATLTDAKDGGTANFIYPASLATSNGSISKKQIHNDQRGILIHSGSGTDKNSISKYFDAAFATGTIAVNDNVASVSGMVTMENQCCICKFDLSVLGTLPFFNMFEVSIAFEGGDTYTLEMSTTNSKLKPFYAAMFPVTNATANITVTGYNRISTDKQKVYEAKATIPNVTLAAGKFYRNVPVTLNYQITLSASDTEVILQTGDELTGTGGENTVLKIAAGATVFLRDVDNTNITQETSIPGIECLGDATIILAGTNRVTGRWNAAGISVPEGHTLTIMGNGTLHATGGSNGAGIGGTQNRSCGNIRIEGGIITATGTGWCAGIGSGWAYKANITCGDITISGGTVTATGGTYAAGIGSGYANQANNTCGDISISGGTVTATGGNNAAGIGSGECGSFASISIGSGISGVTATSGGEYYAPIGRGEFFQGTGSDGSVTIDGTEIDGSVNYSPHNWNPSDLTTPNTTANGHLNWTLSGNTWTLTPAP